MTYRHFRKVVNIVTRNGRACLVCSKEIDDLQKAIIILDDPLQRANMDNFRLRHNLCVRSKYRPVVSPDTLVKLIEAMIADDLKICVVCRKSWVDVEFEHLVLAERSGVRKVLHLVCL